MTRRERSRTIAYELTLVAASVGAIFLVSWAFTAAGPTPAGAGEQAARTMPNPVVDMHGLMGLFNKPLYMYTKEAVASKPTDDAGWKSIQDRGLQTAEVANLVTLHRPEKIPAADWNHFTGDLQQAGLGLAEAAKARDYDAVQQRYRIVIDRCNSCHQAVAPDHAPMLKP